MIETIKYQLSHLADFSGRDARPTFWYYVLFLVVLQFLIGIITAIPLYIGMMSGAMDAARSGADQAQMESEMMAGMSGSLQGQVMIGAVIGVAAIALFVAAFVRRLHDGGFAGWWVLVPVMLQLAAIVASFSTVEIMSEAMRNLVDNPDAVAQAQRDTLVYSLLGWLSYLIVIVFGVWKSDGPNRFGDTSVRF